MSDYGYGDVDTVAKETSQSNKYLTLPTDGKTHRLRIASRPRYAFRHWYGPSAQNPKGGYVPCEGKKDECKHCKAGNNKAAQWGWVVIDRADNYPNDAEAKDTVKVWKESQAPAFLIRDLSELKDRNKQPVWGDPTTFDLIVKKKKKEKAFGFDWTIEPDADHAEPLTDAEKKMVEEAGFDLEKELAGSKYSEHVGNYGGASPQDLETAPEEEHEGDVKPEDIPEDLGSQKKSDEEEVDVEDIPF